jgi:DUF1680 family protein
MLKLTKHLYTHSGELKYVNYYEKALFNHILGQQDPQSGMISYFLPMLPGAHKVYSTPEHSFWCCVGTGFENQAKFGESIYYHTAKELFVNQFIASEVAWKEGELKLKQETEFPKNGEVKLTVLEAGSKPSVIKLRYPYWAKTAKIKVNGKSVKINQKADSYLVFNRNWKKGDVIEANFGMELSVIPTNDNENKIALAYGPIVLAGLMGNEGFIGTTPFSDTSKYNDYYTFDYNIPANIKTSFSIDKKNLAKDILLVSPQKLTFKSAKNNITLRPLYDIHRERYVVYWDLVK